MDKYTLPDLPKMKNQTTSTGNGHAMRWLLLATGLTVVLTLLPYASVLVYPIRLFVTFIHEGSHALATVLTFGSVDSLTVSPDESGLTWSRGGLRPLVSSAGYLGTTLFGALLLLLAQRESLARYLLSACGALILGLTVFFVNGSASWLIILLLGLAVLFWMLSARVGSGSLFRFGTMAGSAVIILMLVAYWGATGTLFSWIVGLILATALLALGRFTGQKTAHFLVNFLAVQCCLNALVDLKTLFLISASSTQHSDAMNMQQITGIPAVFWAVLWGVLALAILVVTLWTVQRRAAKH